MSDTDKQFIQHVIGTLQALQPKFNNHPSVQ